jgi:hypothetical protein
MFNSNSYCNRHTYHINVIFSNFFFMQQNQNLYRHRWTGRYEAHLWDNTCRREGQSRKGRQGNN